MTKYHFAMNFELKNTLSRKENSENICDTSRVWQAYVNRLTPAIDMIKVLSF